MGFERKQGMAVLRSFINQRVPSRVQATSREIARFALQKALELSPYDSGRFGASWRITLGDSSGQPAAPGKRSASAARTEAISASSGVISSIKFGQSWSLSNSVPYAEYVEYGSPTTTPRYITRRVAQSIGGKFGRI